MMRNAHRQHRGFTLIELALVLVMVAIALSVASPSMRGWGRGAKMRDAVQQFIATTSYARSAAISRGQPVRLRIDGASYWLEPIEDESLAPGNPTVRIAGEYLNPNRLPTGMTIAIVDGGVDGAIEFEPLGRVTPATVQLSASWGETVSIASGAPAERFRVITEGFR